MGGMQSYGPISFGIEVQPVMPDHDEEVREVRVELVLHFQGERRVLAAQDHPSEDQRVWDERPRRLLDLVVDLLREGTS